MPSKTEQPYVVRGPIERAFMRNRFANIDAQNVTIGRDITIAPSARIRAKSVFIGDNAFIGEGVVVDIGDFVLGDCSRLQAGTD
jgi:UDP-3-O-[3-hydroxymyristoyl] glucosamine N-acyltransferase